MKKRGILLMAVLLLTTVLAACGQDKAAKNSSQGAGTEETKKLILGLSADFPPYEFHIKNENGEDEIVGFDVEIAKEIAKDMGAELEIKDMVFSSLLNELGSGRVDIVISGLSPSPDRAESIEMSQIYYNAKQAVVAREADKDKYATLESLEGLKIGVQKSSIQEDIAKEIPGAKLTSLAKISDIIMQLNSGRVDVAIIEGPVAESFVKNVEGIAITDAVPVTEDEGYVVGIKKGNIELLDQVNTTLDRLIQDGSIEKFVKEASELSIR
ncbi:transporter substrate-binding domain-containing protein [Paenibacillus lentus]|uniref:Transporter substrate-binding domain-containing protein n=1 Tax=Paenibacillus lentus TaxID=1338368 RepID=A0A3Q8S5D6_9BACL|nr:transporter substrate-binding domain-containing protein [Paenibacillus lentus]AZK47415.1 transporter substrate-binding domain-containing protein [Paenibacillus lentus]